MEPDLLVVANPEQISKRGIPHYWLADPDAETLECFRLEHGVYRLVAEASAPATLTHPDWPDLTIDVGALGR